MSDDSSEENLIPGVADVPSPVAKDDDSDDGWHAKTWDLFVRSAKKGVLSPEDFIGFAKELNVECDVPTVQRFLRPEQQGRITFDVAVKLLENIPLGNVDEEDNSRSAEQVASDVVELGPMDYIKYICGATPPADKYRGEDQPPVRYELRLPRPSPQFWLVFNASLVFTLVSGSIIALVAVNWLNTNTELNTFYIERFGALVKSFANSFTYNSISFVIADLVDHASTFTQWVSRDTLLLVNQTLSNLAEQTQEYAITLEHLARIVVDEHSQELVKAVGNLEEAQALTGLFTMDIVSKLLTRWQTTKSAESIVYELETNTTVFHTSGVSVTAAQLFTHVCSQANAQTAAVSGYSGSADVVPFIGNMSIPGLAAFTYLRSLKVTVCVMISDATFATFPSSALATVVDDANKDATKRMSAVGEVRPFPEIIIADFSNGGYSFTTKALSRGRCKSECSAFQTRLQSCFDRRCSLEASEGPSYDGYSSDIVTTYIKATDQVLAFVMSKEAIIEHKRQQSITALNNVMSMLNPDSLPIFAEVLPSGEIAPMVTNERYPNKCAKVNCTRTPEFDSVVHTALRTGAPLFVVRPNASFVPVLVGAAPIPALNLVYMMELSVQDTITASLQALTRAVDRVNKVIDASMEIQLVRYEGTPPLQLFNPNVSCTANELCIFDDFGAMIYRSNCPYCLPIAAQRSRRVEYITALRWQNCPQCDPNSTVQPLVDNTVAIRALSTLDTGVAVSFSGTDYAGDSVFVSAAPVSNFSIAVIVKVHSSDMRKSVLDYVLIFIGIAIALIVGGLVALIVFSQRTLNQINDEWSHFNRAIQAEKTRFDEMIKETVPGPVIERLRSHVHSITETHSNLSFAFVDVCHFSDKVKTWPPRVVVRTIAYLFHLYDMCGQRFEVFRLRAFGDVGVYVCGLDRHGDEQQIRDAIMKDAFNMGKFAGYVTQLLSPAFAHYPQRLPQFSDAKGDVAPMEPVRCRIGLHSGPAHSGLIDTGKAPFYELYGPSLSICQRMQATAQAGRVNVSANFKELIETVDSHTIFEFDALRKTVVKGRGAISSYPIKSIQLAIDEVLLHQLKVEHAQRMHRFVDKLQVGQKEEQSEMSSEQQSTTLGA